MKCDECGGIVKRKQVHFSVLGTPIGTFMAEVCETCGEEVFDLAESKKITKACKEKGMFGIASKATT